MTRQSRSLILTFTKKMTIKSGSGGAIEKNFGPQGDWNCPGGMLKLRIDRRINQGNPLQ